MLKIRPMTRGPVVAALLLTFVAAQPATAGDSAACGPKATAKTRIGACSGLIQSGDLAGDTLAEALIMRADAYAETSDHSSALADYDQAIRLSKDGVADAMPGDDALAARLALGNAYFKRGSFRVWRKADFARGIADLDQAIALDPDLTAAYSARGWAYQASGDFDRANVDYEEAIRRNVDACPLSMPALHPS